jgi:hypothetical protein
MLALARRLLKIVGTAFVLLLGWLFLEELPRWGLELAILTLAIIALSLWAKCDAWSKRFLLKSGYEEWSKARAEIIGIFLEDR